MKGFLDFIRAQGVVGLAIGLAIGVKAGEAVTAIVNNLISPVVGFLLGGTDLSKLVWETGITNGSKELVFGWGAVVNSLIALVATAFVVYAVIIKLGLTKLDKEK